MPGVSSVCKHLKGCVVSQEMGVLGRGLRFCSSLSPENSLLQSLFCTVTRSPAARFLLRGSSAASSCRWSLREFFLHF